MYLYRFLEILYPNKKYKINRVLKKRSHILRADIDQKKKKNLIIVSPTMNPNYYYLLIYLL